MPHTSGFTPLPRRTGTSRHFLHEDFEVAALASRTQIAHYIFVAQSFVKSDLFMQGLGKPGNVEERAVNKMGAEIIPHSPLP